MITRREFTAVFGLSALAAANTSIAQQQGKVWRIGFIGTTSAASFEARVEALRAGLRDFGYVEGRNIAFEFRWGDGNYDRTAAIAAELVRIKVDVIVCGGTPGVRAAKQATTTIPIVMIGAGDPVAAGLIDSLARPGGNITGSAFFSPEINAKRLELLKTVMPQLTQVAVLLNPNNPTLVTDGKELHIAAQALGLELHLFEVRGANEFESAFGAIAKRRLEALAILDDSMLIGNAKTLAEFVLTRRLPTIGFEELADAGALMSYGSSRLARFRRVGYFVDRIFKGAKPADLPVELPTKFDMIVNRRTAKMLGVTIPQTILARADRIIE
jgi:putative tryptophan/tyrosine transport system substrate-binding protein